MGTLKPETRYRGWAYARGGDYHRNLNPNWSYAPTYLQKMAFVRKFIISLPRETRILDVGCGEGVLVEEFRHRGWNIQGIDLNYESDYVLRGSACRIPFQDQSVGLVLFLDVLEHLAFEEQPKALEEFYRVLSPKGYLVLSIPNLSHLNSRYLLTRRGRLDRTDSEINHVGERPYWENVQLLTKSRFTIVRQTGITFTLPFIYRRVICKQPAKYRWLHDLLEPLARALPSFAMLNIFVCQKAA
ncbi:MAG: class I SAM-dependent methyltransferase [Chloroflexaceae bacterium]|nr:class I SAM-dependent methyltransferase [Chloroflexaceae bacterium]